MPHHLPPVTRDLESADTVEALSNITAYTCATGHLGCGLAGADRYHGTVSPDHAEAQFHILSKNPDDAAKMVDAIRKAAGLPPKYTKPDGEGVEAHPSP